MTDYAEHAEKFENKKPMTSILEWERNYFLVKRLTLPHKLVFSGLLFLRMALIERCVDYFLPLWLKIVWYFCVWVWTKKNLKVISQATRQCLPELWVQNDHHSFAELINSKEFEAKWVLKKKKNPLTTVTE